MSVFGFHGPVSRLTFGYEGQEIRLLSEQIVELTMTTSDSVGAHRLALRIELRDTNGAVAFSQAIASPLQASPEVFSPGGPGTRLDVPSPRGAFVVLVPYIDDARTLVIATRVPGPEDEGESFRELGRFDLAAPGGPE